MSEVMTAATAGRRGRKDPSGIRSDAAGSTTAYAVDGASGLRRGGSSDRSGDGGRGRGRTHPRTHPAGRGGRCRPLRTVARGLPREAGARAGRRLLRAVIDPVRHGDAVRRAPVPLRGRRDGRDDSGTTGGGECTGGHRTATTAMRRCGAAGHSSSGRCSPVHMWFSPLTGGPQVIGPPVTDHGARPVGAPWGEVRIDSATHLVSGRCATGPGGRRGRRPVTPGGLPCGARRAGRSPSWAAGTPAARGR